LPLKLVITIDQQSTKTNGYYSLFHSVREEFLYGIINYNYQKVYEPIWYSKLNLYVYYVKSNLNFPVQASDFIAGETREIFNKYLTSGSEDILKSLDFISFKKFFP